MHQRASSTIPHGIFWMAIRVHLSVFWPNL